MSAFVWMMKRAKNLDYLRDAIYSNGEEKAIRIYSVYSVCLLLTSTVSTTTLTRIGDSGFDGGDGFSVPSVILIAASLEV